MPSGRWPGGWPALLNHGIFEVGVYPPESAPWDPIVGVSFPPACSISSCHALRHPLAENWWEAGRPETEAGLAFKAAGKRGVSEAAWKQVVKHGGVRTTAIATACAPQSLPPPCNRRHQEPFAHGRQARLAPSQGPQPLHFSAAITLNRKETIGGALACLD